MMNTGYKGVVYAQSGHVYCPYNPFEPKSWRDTLRELELKFASWLDIGYGSRESGLIDVNEMMRTRYPGNYTVVEAYDPSRGVFGFKLVFDDPREETMWLLRWS